MFSKNLQAGAENLLQACRNHGDKLATAESCTGGLLSALLTEISGSSDVFDRGFVTYSNDAKHELLGVPHEILQEHGAVSEATAIAMAKGAIAHSQARFAISITGIAGPQGGSKDKPVGLVYFGLCRRGEEATATHEIFSGNRQDVRMATVQHALLLLSRAVAS